MEKISHEFNHRRDANRLTACLKTHKIMIFKVAMRVDHTRRQCGVKISQLINGERIFNF
jgi:hypothetical protein